MKITQVKTILTSPRQNYLFVKIYTDSGIYGVGDASLNGRERAVATLIDVYLAPMLIGRNPEQIEDFWQLAYRGSYWRGGNVEMSALSGIDMALWVILGKSANKPLYALLGGKVRNKVLCYSHIFLDDTENAKEKIADYVRSRQIQVIRLRVGAPAAKGTLGVNEEQMTPFVENWDSEEELERTVEYFARVREAVGEATGIIYDLHERFSPDRAVRVIRQLEPYNPYFIEDPIAPDCVESLRYIREKTCVPLAFGELYKSRWECLPALTGKWVDYLRCDVIRVGGITEARKIAALAETYDTKMAWHGPNDVSPITHAVNWHLNISEYNFGIQEDGTVDDLIKDVVSGGPIYQDGWLVMEDRPGIGCDIDEDAAALYPFRKAYLPICRQKDGSIHTW